MSALKQNPFLVGFGIVMFLGVAGLGYLTYSAMEDHGAARSEYDEKASELKRLQNLKPFPNDEHLKKFQAQRLEIQAKVDTLRKELAAIKIPVEDIAPTVFQDKLRDTVARVNAAKAGSNVVLPDKFYMGFGEYQDKAPRGPAAPLVYRELRAIEEVMNLILEVKNVEVKELTRSELKEEKDNKPAVVTQGSRPKPAEAEGKKVMEKDSFTIKFASTQENFQKILNGIVANKAQFLVPRYILVTNSKQDAPPKVAEVAAAPPPVVEPPVVDPNAPKPADGAAVAPAVPEAKKLEYIFGKELVDVTMEIDLVDVRAPEAPKSEGKK